MLTLPQLKTLVRGNAVLSAAEKAGDIKLVYPKKPTISEDRLYGVFTLEVLLVEADEADLVEAALRRGGFEFKKTKTGWLASYSFPLTPKDREKMVKADKAAKDEEAAVKLAKKDSEIATAIAELRADLQEVKDDQALTGLIKPKSGARGPAGPPGPSGPPGADASSQDLKIGDLSNVSDEEPNEGFVLTYRQGEWQPKAPRTGGGGGGGGSGIQDAPQDGKKYVRQNGVWVEDNGEGQSCTDGGDACDHDPQAYAISGGDACLLVDEQTTQLDAGYGCNTCLEDLDEAAVQGIEEAPQDDKSYVRRNGQWEEAAETVGASQLQELQDQVDSLTLLVTHLMGATESLQFENDDYIELEDGTLLYKD